MTEIESRLPTTAPGADLRNKDTLPCEAVAQLVADIVAKTNQRLPQPGEGSNDPPNLTKPNRCC